VIVKNIGTRGLCIWEIIHCICTCNIHEWDLWLHMEDIC